MVSEDVSMRPEMFWLQAGLRLRSAAEETSERATPSEMVASEVVASEVVASEVVASELVASGEATPGEIVASVEVASVEVASEVEVVVRAHPPAPAPKSSMGGA